METTRTITRCSHCGKRATEVEHLFTSTLVWPNVHICNECLLTYYEIYVDRQNMQRIEEERHQVEE
ncbi:MAG TPA: ClpX C4-type zinc finger protein [Ktedonobacterales bacterium]